MCHTQRQVTTRHSASSPFRPLSRRSCFVLQAEQQRPAKEQVRPPRRANRSAQWCECLHRNTSVLRQVLTARALGVHVVVICCMTAPYSCAAPIALQHIARGTAWVVRRLPHTGWPEFGCCMASVACCTLHVACCLLHIACCTCGAHDLDPGVRARTHARASQSSRFCRYGFGP